MRRCLQVAETAEAWAQLTCMLGGHALAANTGIGWQCGDTWTRSGDGIVHVRLLVPFVEGDTIAFAMNSVVCR